MQTWSVNQIVSTSLGILSSFTNEKDFNEYFLSRSCNIFLQIIIPLLKLSDKEKEDLESDPKEFVNYSIDICQKQKSKTYKT